MKDKLERLTEIIEFGMYNINPDKKEALSIIDDIAERQIRRDND